MLNNIGVYVLWTAISTSLAYVIFYSCFHFTEHADTINGAVDTPYTSEKVSGQVFTYLYCLMIIPSALAIGLIYLRKNKPTISNLVSNKLRRILTVPACCIGNFTFTYIELFLLVLWTVWFITTIYLDVDKALGSARFKRNPGGVATYSQKLTTIGVSIGRAGTICLAFFLFPVSKYSFWLELFGIGMERAVRFHRYFGAFVIATIVIHGFLIMRGYGLSDDVDQFLHLGQDRIWLQNCFGLVSMIGGMLILVTGVVWVRRWSYNLFYYSHIIGFLAFFVFGVLHHRIVLTHCLPAFVTYLVDKLVGLSRKAHKVPVVESTLAAPDCARIRVACQDTQKINVGDHVMVNIPYAARFEWHPISIAMVEWLPSTQDKSVKHQVITLDIKDLGNWSKKVCEAVSNNWLGAVHLNGPFGTRHSSNGGYESHNSQLLVGAGIGITPFILAYQDLCKNLNDDQIVTLAWVIRDPKMLNMYKKVLQDGVAQGKGNVFVDVYVTGETVKDEKDTKSFDAPAIADTTGVVVDYVSNDATKFPAVMTSQYSIAIFNLLLSGILIGFMKLVAEYRTPQWTAQTYLFHYLWPAYLFSAILALVVYVVARQFFKKTEQISVSLPGIEADENDGIVVHAIGKRPTPTEVIKNHISHCGNKTAKSIGFGISGPTAMMEEFMSESRKASKEYGVEFVVDNESYEW